MSDINLLVLDEPTNYLDINSLEVVEEALKNYEKTVLFVSHDRRFVKSVANRILSIENHKLITFAGNYEEYMGKRNNKTNINNEELKKQIFIFEFRLSELIGKISMAYKNDNVEQLDKEYYEVLKKLQELKRGVFL